ncbi:MAG TPA: tetratricopeptide repeat protein [Candidatus Baltobacteraceae bacterium]|nr:tetratricopeptide repeat protein [Candidatus Baltobacteraceae bacterium]
MSVRALALALCMVAGLPQVATAQSYGTPTPTSTDRAALRNLAIAREVRERFARGMAALERFDYPTAVTEFEDALKRDLVEPQNSTAHYNLGLALAGAHDFDRAASELQAAIARDPGFLAAYANLITVDLDRNDAAGARAAADRFIALAPTSARALYSQGLVALRSGDTATARADFSKLLERNPAYAPAHYDLALVALQAGRLDVAERELHDALTSSPEYPRARFALGIVLLREGRRAEARMAFEAVVHAASDPSLRNMALSIRDSIAQ